MLLGVAFRAFFAALFDRQRAEAIRVALDCEESELQRLTAAVPDKSPAAKTDVATPARPAAVGHSSTDGRDSARPARSDAVTLLATLQREARLIDLIQEPLDQYSDAQVGAAARPCLAQCRATLKRIFDLRPLVDSPEGQSMEVPEQSSPLRFQWVGNAAGSRRSGKLVHPGWEAARCELAQWTGDAADAYVVAPAQLEP